MARAVELAALAALVAGVMYLVWAFVLAVAP